MVALTLQTPAFIFPSPWEDMMANKESTVSVGGLRRMACKSGRASCGSRRNCMAHPFLRSAPALSGVCMSMWTRWGGGSNPFAHPTTSPTSRSPV